MKTALNVAGFSSKRPLEHCYSKISGFDLTWDEVEERGIEFYEACLMSKLELIQWKPDLDILVSQIQLEELKFIHGLKFKTDLPAEYVNAMLSELKQPYYYSHNCIYWDFSAAKWKYFKSQNSIRQVHNPGADSEDKIASEINNQIESSINKDEELYNSSVVYKVEHGNTIAPSFKLVSIGVTDWTVELKVGDQVRFKH